MAVISDIESKIEEAWIKVLGDNTDLVFNGNPIPIRAADDLSKKIVYPIVLVDAGVSFQPEESFGQVGVDEVLVDLIAKTYIDNDPTGSVVKGMLGAIRDTMRDVLLVNNLNAIVGLTVFAVTQPGGTFKLDENRVRMRTLTVRCPAVAQDVL